MTNLMHSYVIQNVHYYNPLHVLPVCTPDGYLLRVLYQMMY